MGTFKSYSTIYFNCLFLWKRPRPEIVYVCSCSVSFSGKHTRVAYIITFLHPKLLSRYKKKKKKNLYLSCSLIYQISPTGRIGAEVHHFSPQFYSVRLIPNFPKINSEPLPPSQNLNCSLHFHTVIKFSIHRAKEEQVLMCVHIKLTTAHTT